MQIQAQSIKSAKIIFQKAAKTYSTILSRYSQKSFAGIISTAAYNIEIAWRRGVCVCGRESWQSFHFLLQIIHMIREKKVFFSLPQTDDSIFEHVGKK